MTKEEAKPMGAPKRDYSIIAKSDAFRTLMARKKRFILPMSLFFLSFYFILPILTSYTELLNRPAVGAITWAWVFAAAQFIMTWALCMLYYRKAMVFDAMAAAIVKEETSRDREVQL
jgi:uncharacterized membrane protein (DUF485 family)